VIETKLTADSVDPGQSTTPSKSIFSASERGTHSQRRNGIPTPTKRNAYGKFFVGAQQAFRDNFTVVPPNVAIVSPKSTLEYLAPRRPNHSNDEHGPVAVPTRSSYRFAHRHDQRPRRARLGRFGGIEAEAQHARPTAVHADPEVNRFRNEPARSLPDHPRPTWCSASSKSLRGRKVSWASFVEFFGTGNERNERRRPEPRSNKTWPPNNGSEPWGLLPRRRFTLAIPAGKPDDERERRTRRTLLQKNKVVPPSTERPET